MLSSENPVRFVDLFCDLKNYFIQMEENLILDATTLSVTTLSIMTLSITV